MSEAARDGKKENEESSFLSFFIGLLNHDTIFLTSFINQSPSTQSRGLEFIHSHRDFIPRGRGRDSSESENGSISPRSTTTACIVGIPA